MQTARPSLRRGSCASSSGDAMCTQKRCVSQHLDEWGSLQSVSEPLVSGIEENHARIVFVPPKQQGTNSLSM